MKNNFFLTAFFLLIICSCSGKKNKANNPIKDSNNAKSEISPTDSTDVFINYFENAKKVVDNNYSNDFEFTRIADESITKIDSILYLSEVNNTINNSNLLVSLRPNCHRISGKSWRCCGNISITRDGRFSGRIQTSSNRAQGFTGAIIIEFLDKKKNYLFHMESHRYGVNGYSKRSDNWIAQLNEYHTQALNTVSYVSVYSIHTPTHRTGKLVVRGGLDYLTKHLRGYGLEDLIRYF